MTNHSSTPFLSRTDLDAEDLYPIREVSRLTGVNPVTLRAWERRYGLLVPHRTESGHRLYSMADIDRVRAVTAWIERGVTVSKVATIIDREAVPQARSPGSDIHPDTTDSSDYQPWQNRLVEVVSQFDIRELERVYGQIFASFPLPVVFAEIVLPVWRRYREAHLGSDGSGHWTFLDTFLRGKIFQRLGYMRADVPLVLLINLPGPQEELESLVVALSIAAADADVAFVPQSFPLTEIAIMAERSRCAAVVLLSERTVDTDMLARHLPRLEQALECPLGIAGKICEIQTPQLEQAGLVCLGDATQALTARVRALLAGRLDA
ncbi:MAG TPA: MerR family transcriptional regulator [Pseudomonas xinjiangensis]|uniref:MerR family transcriptional regulator n=2 Tax=root TaxID=1 RepID=A0A7V1BMI3_9GAMM|nr:MerR family transcriptional regulator [Halopseudomonas xinjiangensis]HEC49184.1 MerR family transcriptional regulator [Halopseudomonas xinjiangensis]